MDDSVFRDEVANANASDVSVVSGDDQVERVSSNMCRAVDVLYVADRLQQIGETRSVRRTAVVNVYVKVAAEHDWAEIAWLPGRYMPSSIN